jgi:hypothetical protein
MGFAFARAAFGMTFRDLVQRMYLIFLKIIVRQIGKPKNLSTFAGRNFFGTV